VFSKIIGHNSIRDTLSNLVGKPGSFLFYGPPSVGKKTVALEIAKNTLCVSNREDNCSCKSCRIFPQDHPDFLLLGDKGKVLVDDVDNLLFFNSRSPLVSSTKIVVIDSVENSSKEASNRLLKTLEESPFSFFLITTEVSCVLPTIVSRCFKVKFEPLLAEEISNILFTKFGFDAPSSRALGWIGSATSIDIFLNAGVCLKYRDMACDFIMTIRDLLRSLDFVERVETAHLGIFCDMLVTVLTDVLFLKNGINDIINADKRDILQKVAKVLNDRAVVTSLGFLTQVKRNAHLNINLGLSLKSMLIKVNPILSLT
jgi:DNA polymerase-3 subunit delta'